MLQLMGRQGVPLQRVAALGLALDPAQHEGRSYAEVLRALPPERGVQLEFWRSSPCEPGGGPREGGRHCMQRQPCCRRCEARAVGDEQAGGRQPVRNRPMSVSAPSCTPARMHA